MVIAAAWGSKQTYLCSAISSAGRLQPLLREPKYRFCIPSFIVRIFSRERDAVEYSETEARQILSLSYQIRGLPPEEADRETKLIRPFLFVA